MTCLPEDLRTYIVAASTVTALIGTRCHYNHIPESAAQPHVWFRVASDTEERTMDGTGGLHEAQVDLECAGVSESSVQNVADAIKNRLDGYKGTLGSITCQAAFLRDKDDDYVPYSNQSDDGVHVVAYSLAIWYST